MNGILVFSDKKTADINDLEFQSNSSECKGNGIFKLTGENLKFDVSARYYLKTKEKIAIGSTDEPYFNFIATLTDYEEKPSSHTTYCFEVDETHAADKPATTDTLFNLLNK